MLLSPELCQSLSMEYVRAARLLTKEAQLYLQEVLPLARETLKSSFTTFFLITRLLHAIARPLLALLQKLYNVLFPAISILLMKLWSAFCLQPARALAVEAAISLALVFVSYLERRFRFLPRLRLFCVRTSSRVKRNYQLCLAEIRAKSKLAALATPHIIFICLACLFHSIIGKRVSYFLQGARLLVLACIRPAVRSAMLLYTVEVETVPETASETAPTNSDFAHILNSSQNRSFGAVTRRRRWSTGHAIMPVSPATTRVKNRDTSLPRNSGNRYLSESESNDTPQQYSSVLALFEMPDCEKEQEALELATLRFWVVFALAWAVRSFSWYFCPALFKSMLVNLDNFLLYFLLWTELDITRGSETIYSLISRTVRGSGQRRAQNRLEKFNVVLRVLVATGVVSEDRAGDLSTVVAESGLALLGGIFLITPRMVTFVGTIAVGFILPSYLSQGVIESREAKVLYRHNWLSYWSMLYLIEIVYTATAHSLAWLPLWYHAKLAVVLWLQLPYFRGAATVLDRVMEFLGKTMSSVQRQVVTPRKRKRA
ncbi:unnamed protein product [Agarophyton chilense]